MRLAAAIVFALAILIPDHSLAVFEAGTDPERAGMCGGFDGLAFTFCVALCEARECDRQPLDDARCDALQRGFDRVSNGRAAPCEAGGSWYPSLDPL